MGAGLREMVCGKWSAGIGQQEAVREVSGSRTPGGKVGRWDKHLRNGVDPFCVYICIS